MIKYHITYFQTTIQHVISREIFATTTGNWLGKYQIFKQLVECFILTCGSGRTARISIKILADHRIFLLAKAFIFFGGNTSDSLSINVLRIWTVICEMWKMSVTDRKRKAMIFKFWSIETHFLLSFIVGMYNNSGSVETANTHVTANILFHVRNLNLKRSKFILNLFFPFPRWPSSVDDWSSFIVFRVSGDFSKFPPHFVEVFFSWSSVLSELFPFGCRVLLTKRINVAQRLIKLSYIYIFSKKTKKNKKKAI